MSQKAIIAVPYTDDDGFHAGFVIIELPHDGDPANAGMDLLSIGANPETASTLRGQGFRGQPPQAHPNYNYSQVVTDAQANSIPHIHRMGDTQWEYHNTSFMWRGFPMTADNINQTIERHAMQVSRTTSPETSLPRELTG